MLSFEPEIEQLRSVLGDTRTGALIARERREVFSLYPELRIAAWAGAMLLAGAAGIVLKNNLERIGPLALATLIAVAAIACYAWVWWRRARAGIADDYVLLLGALLVSADVAFIEQQFHLLDHHWPRHFLLLAVVHGVGAYVYRSRTLLSLSIAALAAWLGIERRTLDFSVDLAPRAFLCAALLIAWREIHRRVAPRGEGHSRHACVESLLPAGGEKVPKADEGSVILSRADGEGSSPDGPAPEFLRVFEHFAANLALWGGLTLLSENETFNAGCLVTLVIAAVVMRWGFARRAEAFVLYGFIYAVIAADALLIHRLHDGNAISFIVLVSMIVAIAALATIHRRFHERRT